jgi:endonuclease/exonuclease/phosphatase family metal-dependent hydrolase
MLPVGRCDRGAIHSDDRRMCRRVVLLLLVVMAVVVGRGAVAETTLRVLSYNIHHGRGTDGVVNLERIAGVIRGCGADVAMLQEVDDRTDRTGRIDQTSELARLTGLHAEFGRQIDYQGGRYGQAILSRTPLQEPRVHVLPGEPDRETRIAFAVRTEVAGQPLVIVGTHLHHLDPAARLEQARAIEALDLGAGPAILGGDLNAVPGSEPLAALLARWRSTTTEPQPTFPAGSPTRQIDFILYRAVGVLESGEVRVLDEPVASDHRPILAEFRLR